MMHSLWLAMALMALLSVAVFFATRRLVSRLSHRWLEGLAAVIVVLIGVYVRSVWGQLWIVRWIPLASVVVLANWFPLLLGALAGVFWVRTQTQTFWRRLPAQAVLMAGAVWSEIYVIPRHPPECGNEWIEKSPTMPYRICRQTTPYTCSAAAAATILTALGVETSEAEMSRLCLTREGTTWLGLYHGLTVRLQETDYRAEFFECSVADLPAAAGEFPLLLCCCLTPEVDEEFPAYAEERGWKPGVSHSTVLLRYHPPVCAIGDPSQPSPEFWSTEDLENLWTGTGLRIVTIEETMAAP
jgi:hypothetical protein